MSRAYEHNVNGRTLIRLGEDEIYTPIGRDRAAKMSLLNCIRSAYHPQPGSITCLR